MLNGIQILVERMKTHPDEFNVDGRWVDFIVGIDKHLTDEERNALKQGYKDMARDYFNGLILKELSGERIDPIDIELLRVDYDGIIAYPLKRAQIEEEERKYRMEQKLMADKIRMTQAMQAQGMGSTYTTNHTGALGNFTGLGGF